MSYNIIKSLIEKGIKKHPSLKFIKKAQYSINFGEIIIQYEFYLN